MAAPHDVDSYGRIRRTGEESAALENRPMPIDRRGRRADRSDRTAAFDSIRDELQRSRSAVKVVAAARTAGEAP